MLPRITLARLAQAFSLGVPQQQALQQAAGLEQPPAGALPLLQRMLILLDIETLIDSADFGQPLPEQVAA